MKVVTKQAEHVVAQQHFKILRRSSYLRIRRFSYLRNTKCILKQEYIPVGCIPHTAVAVMGWSPHPRSRHSPGAGTLSPGAGILPPRSRYPLGAGTPLARSPSTSPLECGPGPDPPQFSPWLWAWTRSPSTPPLGVGLETPLARSP